MKTDKTLCILVADNGAARIFKCDGKLEDIRLQRNIIHPAAHKYKSELASDRPGRTSDSSGHHHALGDSQKNMRHESDAFAHYLCLQLRDDLRAGNFDELYLAASPHFLGDLRHHLTPDCQKALKGTLDKDLVHADERDILDHFRGLAEQLRPHLI